MLVEMYFEFERCTSSILVGPELLRLFEVGIAEKLAEEGGGSDELVGGDTVFAVAVFGQYIQIHVAKGGYLVVFGRDLGMYCFQRWKRVWSGFAIGGDGRFVE